MRRHWAGILFLVCMALPFVFALRQGRAVQASPDEVIVILSPHNREVKAEYSRAFAAYMAREQHRNVGIRWLDVGGASRCLKELESRFKATPDHVGVDILFGGGVDPYLRAKRLGWLSPVLMTDDAKTAIPAECGGFPVYDPDGSWYGVALSSFGIIRNAAMTETLGLPDAMEWEDLALPEYATWVAGGDPRSSGSVHACYEIILQAYGFEKGWRLIAQMCANVRQFGEDGGDAPRTVASGDAAAGMVIGQYAERIIKSIGDERLAYALPSGTTVINPDAIAVIKNGPNPGLAALFVQFCLTDEGQRILFQPAGKNGQAQPLYRMPVRAELYADADAPHVAPYSYRARFSYDSELGDRRWTIVNDCIGSWLIDPHADLVAAWARVRAAGCPREAVEALFAPPCSESEMADLAKNWKDATRADTRIRWSQEAPARYRSIRPPEQ